MSEKLITCDICGGEVEKAPARHRSPDACLASAMLRLANSKRKNDGLRALVEEALMLTARRFGLSQLWIEKATKAIRKAKSHHVTLKGE